MNNKNSNNSGDKNIYLLPNLMTAGNLFCGFTAIILIFQGISSDVISRPYIEKAILFIFGSCIFDILDGRVARLGGKESLFGKEFDSLSDIVSFGVTPALLVYSVVLKDFTDRIGLLLAFFYLLCGALRLARFNSYTPDKGDGKEKNDDFMGFPIPAAAGVTVSITHTLIWFLEGEKNLGNWKYLLPVIMLLVSVTMMSNIRYPSFKNITWTTKKSTIVLLTVVFVLILMIQKHEWLPTVFFLLYFFYGFVRPYLPKKVIKNIE